MTETDPLVPVLPGLVVDVLGWLDACDDEEVDPDTAVKMLEFASWVLVNLPEEQRGRLSLTIERLADTEKDPERRELLTRFPSVCGLVEGPSA